MNVKRIQDDVLSVYRRFLDDPLDKQVIKRAIDLDRELLSVVDTGEYDSSQRLPDHLVSAINDLTRIVQYREGVFDDDELLDAARQHISQLNR